MSEFTAIAGTIIGLSVLTLWRVVRGRTTFDRLLAAAAIGTNAIALLAVVGFIFDRPDLFVDLAITYALLNFVGSVAVAKYLERHGADTDGPGEEHA